MAFGSVTLRLAVLVVTLVVACRSKDSEPGDGVDGADEAPHALAEVSREPVEPPGIAADADSPPGSEEVPPAAGAESPAEAEGGDMPPPSEPTPAADLPPAGEATPSPADLLKEARSKKTSDARALEALAEAERAGTKPKELSKAAQTRGEALYSEPDRAKAFFEWAAQKDPKNPAPTFSLAKQAAMLGDIPNTKLYLQQTHERGGQKLLQQIDFDPTWEIVKDDPDVRKLLQ